MTVCECRPRPYAPGQCSLEPPPLRPSQIPIKSTKGLIQNKLAQRGCKPVSRLSHAADPPPDRSPRSDISQPWEEKNLSLRDSEAEFFPALFKHRTRYPWTLVQLERSWHLHQPVIAWVLVFYAGCASFKSGGDITLYLGLINHGRPCLFAPCIVPCFPTPVDLGTYSG